MTAEAALQPTPEVPSRLATLWQASVNTAGCLLGCVIGDFSTIYAFQLLGSPWPPLAVMALAMFNGILTSLALETLLMMRSMPFVPALRTAFGMSILSMLAMEAAMNGVDLWLVGEARLVWWVIPPMLLAGFLVPLPYNYWRLRVLGKACH